MKNIVLVLFATFYLVQGQDCDPGVCKDIPGLVYNAELDQCAWPDEMGCSLQGNSVGYY